ncbi:MAG: PEP/pyruvate-binding domain-containing protein [Bacteroidales bacterium]|nr:PEP/pyruvate-binding domain-containing protein [Bacteroidales bacterium]
MIKDISLLSKQEYDFNDTSFNLLLQKRIYKILLVCSNYDYFMLEEDGRIDEQIFNEYTSLNLRYPPVFTQADSEEKAFEILENEDIDLIILVKGTQTMDIFMVAKKIKHKYFSIPIVVLTYFTREVSLRLENEDLSAIDYVFSWLENADLLVAIIKLIEDKMNAKYDVEEIGVQTILLVEDSIRYTSSYLPTLYKIVLVQSRAFQQEALNDHQQMLRMRGRPKILLATTFEGASELFNRFKDNMLGVISDVSFNREGKKDTEAGIKFCKLVRESDKHMPFLLQSSSADNETIAKELGVGFLYKFSRTLSFELRNFIIRNLAFGPFIFRDPEILEEIDRAENLQEFQQKLMSIPDESLAFHTDNNHFSKWLNARALFPLAQMFKYLRREDFSSLDDVRSFVYVAISSFRLGKGRGIIAKFDKKSFDEYLIFSRIGNGSIGGKARGLAFLNSFIKTNDLYNKYPNIHITIPRTVVITTDVFDEFMESNELFDMALSDIPDEEILQNFLKAELPSWIYQDLYAIVSVLTKPIAVRSSSKLEDSYYQPFAGIYSTYMIPKVGDSKRMVQLISDAIKEVYASVYFKTSKSYITATAHLIGEEKMGIILQEVCGNAYGDYYYPTFSGVARSINFYPVGNEESKDGVARVGLGLGKLVVEGGMALRFSPKYPRKILQLSSPDMALKSTQKFFYALDLSEKSFVPSTDDGVNLKKLSIEEASKTSSFKYLASTYDFESQMIRDGIMGPGKKIITFSQILNHNVFPLAEILRELLDIGQKEMGNPVEIEFAVNLEPKKNKKVFFNALQIRPIVDNEQGRGFKIDEIDEEKAIIISESAMGNGIVTDVSDIIYIKPESFNPALNVKIVNDIEKINSKFRKENKNYVLIGPGRWGSQDSWLGIPVKWPQISQAKVIVESGLENFRVDPSQGSHFFQNLTAFRVGYFTINPFINDGYYDIDFLNKLEPIYEDDLIRHVRFNEPLIIQIDGRHNRGVVLRPDALIAQED